MRKLMDMIRKKQPQKAIELSVEETQEFLNGHGIDVENLGFPAISRRSALPLDKYYCTFHGVNVTPIREEGVVKTVISGTYIIQPAANHKEADGLWHPGDETVYDFTIKDGKLDYQIRG